MLHFLGHSVDFAQEEDDFHLSRRQMRLISMCTVWSARTAASCLFMCFIISNFVSADLKKNIYVLLIQTSRAHFNMADTVFLEKNIATGETSQAITS